jgi:5-methylcytosine-specific restriction protein A
VPGKIKKGCGFPGCPNTTGARFCRQHTESKQRVVTTSRPSAAERGYDRKWRRLRKWYASRHPLCERCSSNGITRAMEDVHHLIPFRGVDDPLRLDPTNLQSLCKQCHSRIPKKGSMRINTQSSVIRYPASTSREAGKG